MTLSLGAFASTPTPIECNAAQAGISKQQELIIILEALVDQGGGCPMRDLYVALNAAMSPHTLSPGGRALLRRHVNWTWRNAGLVEAETEARKTATWQITPLGLSTIPPKVVQEPARNKTPNETAVWLGTHMTPPRGRQESDLYRMMRAALCKRLPVSANAGLVEDHIQNYMVRAIRRNALHKLIIPGREIPYSKVVAYCVNSGRTDARDMGTEPVCREMLGARTEKERKDMVGPQNRVAALDTDGNVIPEHAEVIDEARLDFDTIWDQIENVVHDHKPRAYKRYTGILAMRAKGFTTRDIAEAENVSRNRAASMLAEARKCVRAGYVSGDLDGFISIAGFMS